jgi:hypothetical protein
MPEATTDSPLQAAVPRGARCGHATRWHAMLRDELIKIGAKVVRHLKYVAFQLADVVVPRELFVAILDRIQRFGVPPKLAQRG